MREYPNVVYILFTELGGRVVEEDPRAFVQDDHEVECAKYVLDSVVRLKRAITMFDGGKTIVLDERDEQEVI